MRESRNIFKYITLISMGFFSILAQTLLFRNFLIIFDGNELSIGIFFFTWLIWVCGGAYFAKLKFFSKMSKIYPLVLLVYIPCFILQYLAFLNAQEILGIHFFELISLQKIILFVFVFNAPVSFMTGFLFVLATGWIKSQVISIPVIKIYMCEAFGSFIGASLVTLLLYFSFNDEYVCLVGMFVLLFAVGVHIFSFRSILVKFLYTVLITCCLFFILSDFSTKLNSRINKEKWTQLVKGGKYLGSFITPQAKYIYGDYKGELIVTSSNTVYEAFPNYNASCNIAGEYLAQSPKAENILVIGPGTYSICNALKNLKQIKEITWLDSDPQYPDNFLKLLRDKSKTNLSKINVVKKDVRKYLSSNNDKYDLIILHLPVPSNLLLNRYFSYEFFRNLKYRLAPDGVVGISFPGGENFLGPELSLLGSSIYFTVNKVFNNIVLKPGAESIFFAADRNGLVSDSGNVLSERLKTIEGIDKIYSPDQIKSSYEENRILFQLSIYKKTLKQYSEHFLFNTDKSPKSFLYSLLLSAKTLSNISLTASTIYTLFRITLIIVLFILFLYFILRVCYYFIFSNKEKKIQLPEKIPCKFDLYISVCAAAIVGMGLNLLLLFLFQINFGTLYLCFGLITALFMLGMTVNSYFIGRLLNSKYLSKVLPYVSFLFIIFLLVIYFYPPLNSILYFSILFFLAGFFSGSYFPISGYYLKKLDSSDLYSASSLEFADNIGGAFGSVVFSVFLLPIVGLSNTLFILSIIVAVVSIHLLFLKSKDRVSVENIPTTVKLDSFVRVVGYIMLIIATICIVIFYYKNHKQYSNEGKAAFILSKQKVLDLTGYDNKAKYETLKFKGEEVPYYIIKNKDNSILGYIFRTKDFSHSITGYAGPINIMSFLCAKGRIQNFTIIDSNETHSYLQEVLRSKNIFLGQKAYANEKYDLNAVTGATATSKAISEILYYSGSNFFAGINSNEENLTTLTKKIDISYPFLIMILVSLIVIIYRFISFKNYNNSSRKFYRTLFLVFILIVFGIIYNVQFSIEQIFTLISGRIYLNLPHIYLFLCIGIPAIVIMFGNIYCGYLCPFGALQELINQLASKLKLNLLINNDKISPFVWKTTRTFKYLLLFVIVILFAKTLDKTLFTKSDILLNAFSFTYAGPVQILLLTFLFISIFYKRFWCRVFCPSGAFLSIFNAIHRLFRKSKIIVKNCDIGVTGKNDFDCICCDKCFGKYKNFKKVSISNNILFLIICVLLLLIISFQIFLPKTSIPENYLISKENIGKVNAAHANNTKIKFSEPVLPIKSIGVSRKIDNRKYKSYILENKLSNREAMYYKILNNT